MPLRKKIKSSLPLSVIIIIELCTSHCFNYVFFLPPPPPYNNHFYQQKFCLLMGSLRSSVLACLFLESKHFKYILPNDIYYFRYIDDGFNHLPKQIQHNTSVTNRPNLIEPTINFTYKLEKKNFLTLEILLINNSNKLKFKVYHKANSKNDYIHFYLNNNKIKSGIFIGFFPQLFLS